jgi:hypothetical protein
MPTIADFFDKADYFYFDQANQKQGPVGKQKLMELKSQGIVVPDTPIETTAGQKVVARDIPGLFPLSHIDQKSYYYFDRANKKQGPLSRLELEALEAKGIISPDTVIEMPSGEQGPAKSVKGLIKEKAFQSSIGETVGAGIKSASKKTATFGCLLVVFLGVACIFAAIILRIMWSILFQ